MLRYGDRARNHALRELEKLDDPFVSPIRLVKNLFSPMPFLAVSAARNTRTPTWALDLAFKRGLLHEELAKNPETSKKTLNKICSSPSSSGNVLYYAAEHPKAGLTEWRLIAQHSFASGTVLQWMIARCDDKLVVENAWVTILTRRSSTWWSSKTDENAVCEIFGSTHADPRWLEQGIEMYGESEKVLRAIAQSPNAPKETAVLAYLMIRSE